MAKSISITVHPSAVGAEYLTVSDAMRQVLDLIAALENTESRTASSRQIVWRLTEAHTSSPPFTVVAEAFSTSPELSVESEASRVANLFSSGLKELLDGHDPTWIDDEAAAPLKRVFNRNVNGIGRTQIVVDGNEPFNIVPNNTRAAIAILEHREINESVLTTDYSRTEYGAVEVEVYGITRWNDKPALMVRERLSQDRVTCVLSQELAEKLGPHHLWSEAWEGNRLQVGGALHYGRDGELKRIDANSAEVKVWTDVTMAEIQSIDILQGRSVSEHLHLLRGEDVG
mgnify:CR=1 FL=1